MTSSFFEQNFNISGTREDIPKKKTPFFFKGRHFSVKRSKRWVRGLREMQMFKWKRSLEEGQKDQNESRFFRSPE